MSQSFFKSSSFSSILFLLIIFFFLSSSIFFLLNNSDSYTSFLTEEDPSFSLSPPASILKTGTYFSVTHDSLLPQKDTLLLLRGLFPSYSLLNFCRYNELTKPQARPLVLPASSTTFSPTEGKIFLQQIDFQDQNKKLRQRLSAQPENLLVFDQAVALLSDDLEFGRPKKPGGRLVINSKYPRYCFPVSWPFFFRDGFGDPRGGHRLHIGIDIFAEEGTEVYAITDGVIQQLTTWKGAGNTILLRGKDGRGYIYMHLQGYAAGINEGLLVKKGELIAYVGHTGTQSSSPHLHLQVHADQSFSKDCALNPYDALVTLCKGKGVIDQGRSKPIFSQARKQNKELFSSESSRQDLFLMVKRSASINSTLLDSSDGGSVLPRESGLDWRVPDPSWKVPRANFISPVKKSEIPPSPTRITWTWPKRKPSNNLLHPGDR